MNRSFVNNIFNNTGAVEPFITELFQYQYAQNQLYRSWCSALGKTPATVSSILQIPFLPISFFKTLRVATGDFNPELIFQSSGTTQTINSNHLVKEAAIYTSSFTKAFELFYGPVTDYCIIGLLPSYLERQNSSLVMMVDELIKLSKHPSSGFYLNEFERLHQQLQQLEAAGQKTLLIGVTFALLDFAEAYPMYLQHTIVMETGGMKGRRKEMTREEVHGYLQKQWHIKEVHSEYGMTELLSQAYSQGNGRFICPPWMKVCVRDEEDPLQVSAYGKGILNVIDLCNIYSCAFIATDDVGTVYGDGSFEVWGRLDNSDIRGCSLLVL